jgi:hypothetical protein
MVMKSLQAIAALAFLLTWPMVMNAQANCSYVVVSQGNYTLSQIDQAFSGANMDAYRKQSIRRTLTFNNGAVVQLLSATELQGQGCNFEQSLVMPDNAPVDANRRFELSQDGYIIELVDAKARKN